ncbi:fatty acyl-AMP ligase [Actinomadura atramentaria]|uniref:fatty acyl-AMP ligase n=1 Tax=Actinomadura atramentaria TaxID=1990 RepID=UPI000380DA1D|nr:fatty acyl-AMP ligase [Actinomadura atramentaria]
MTAGGTLPPRAGLAGTLADVLARRAEATPDRLAFSFLDDDLREERRFTYADLYARAARLGAALRAGLPPGARVLLLLPPGPDYVVAVFGCFHAGAVAVSAAPPSPAQLDRALPRLRSIVADARVSGVVTNALVRSFVDGLAPLTDDGRPLLWLDAEDAGRPGGPLLPPTPTDPDTSAFLQYTSGSTADPRGVMVGHRNLLANCAALVETYGADADSVLFSWLPPYHDMGLIGGVLQPVYVGAPCHVVSPVAVIRRPRRWLEGMSRFRATISGGPNFMYDRCVLRCPPDLAETLDLSHWRVAVNGAEPVRAATMEAFAAAFAPAGFRAEAFAPSYGLAEATLVVTASRRGPAVRRFDAAELRAGRARPADDGVPLAGNGEVIADHTVRIVDPETLAPCPDGVIGEVWVQGPSVALGYWDDPRTTSATFRARIAGDPGAGDFLRSGDLGFLRDGELFVTGRRKEVLIINGANHHPHDLEAAAERGEPRLRPHCGAAFTVEGAGAARVVLVLEAAGDRPDAGWADVVAGVRERVAADTGVPVEAVVLVGPRAVPKTTSGKIQRLRCRDRLLSGDLPVVAAWSAGDPPFRTAGQTL